MTSSITDIMDAIAGQLSDSLDSQVANLQVESRMMWNPTPPAIDVYPADPLTEPITYGQHDQLSFVVRARVDTPDREGGQDLLLSLMDPYSDSSVEQALFEDPTFGGKAGNSSVSGASQFGVFVDPGGNPLLGCTWTVTVYP